MQFTFKRPQTSKSVSAFYRDKQKTNSLPKVTEPSSSSQVDESNDPNKRWRQAAEKINRQMVIHKALHANSQPFHLLSKIGGHVYSSQQNLARVETPPAKARIRVSSKERKPRETGKEGVLSRDADKTERVLQAQVGESKLRRKKRGENFRMGLEKQLIKNDIFYESPVVKIGYNMQFQAYLRLEHISQIRPDHGGSICRNSIIFFLKDAPFSPNIISEKNTEVPIALSLFPEFFDSKLSVSNIKRQRYFQRMLDRMNGTYDPQRMAAMPHVSDYPSFNHERYNEVLESLMTSNEHNYKSEWAENIFRRVRLRMNEEQMRDALAEQWEFFNKANAIITLDYLLKNGDMAKKLNVAPYLHTRVVTSKKILYHGGYCRTLYTSWSSYVESSRKRLAGRLRNYNCTTQRIFGWYCYFQDLQLFEGEFSALLEESVSVNLFHKIQLAKIAFTADVLQQIWFRGILCLFHYGRYLMKQEDEYHHLAHYRHLLAEYIQEARTRSLGMKSGEEVEGFYLNFYQNFLDSLRRQNTVSGLEELLGAQRGEEPQLSNLKVLLQIQFSRTIERSFLSLRHHILHHTGPLLRLHLVIDRQTFKFQQQEEDIVSAFAEVIKKLFAVRVSGFALGCRFAPQPESELVGKGEGKTEEGSGIREYPEIFETGERNSLDEEQELNIGYRTEFIFQDQVRQMLGAVRSYYKECYSVLGEYEMYLPFIKLTTTQKIFSQEEGSIEQGFLKNLRVVWRYKQSIARLQKLVSINIFQVDCSAPIKSLQERISEIQYIIQQNYINIIHEKIEAVDSQLNSLKISAHNLALTPADIDLTEDSLHVIRHSLTALHAPTRKIAQMVLFCLDNRRKAETVVTCYCQLVAKKTQLLRDVDGLFAVLDSKRPEVEAESQQQAQQLLTAINAALQRASEAQTTPFEFINLPDYIGSLAALLTDFQQLQGDISKNSDHRTHTRVPLGQRVGVFRRETQRFQLMLEYWKQFYAFQSYFKDIGRVQVRSLDFKEFSEQLKSSDEVMGRVQAAEQEWWATDRAGWKPVVHRMHDYYTRKFRTDVETCLQFQPLLLMLTNRKVRERHWQHYGLEHYRTLNFRQLTRTEPTAEDETKLKRMHEEVNFEYQILLAYEEIQRKIKSHRLVIVDLNDSDVLDLQNLRRCVEFLRNVEIEIKELMVRDVGGYYRGELQELLGIAQATVGKIERWGAIEQRYIRFVRFHMANDDYQHSLFASLLDLHRKLVKSYDIDNSLAFVSKNIVMDSYLDQLEEELEELETRVARFLASLRADYPRLFLLNDKELFDFMSAGADVQKYLKKCFPQISEFAVKEGSIQGVGKRELTFAEPLYFQEMAGRVGSWVSSLEDLIRCRLKEYFKTNQVITEGKSALDLDLNFYEKYPRQLALLDEQISFTEQLGDAVATESLQGVLEQVQGRIEGLLKEKKENFKLLLLLLAREQVNALLRVEDLHSQSFEWLKYPRFYRKGQIDVRVAFIHQENAYGFNYLEKSELIFTDSVFMGNCLVGPSGSGKTAFARHLAYLCGQELLIFDPRCIDNTEEAVSALLNCFKVNAFVGNWLLLQRVDLLGECELRLIAECLAVVQEGLKQQTTRITLSGQATPLNRNCRILLSVGGLSGSELPGRLCALVRPVWVARPRCRFLLELYLQSKRVNSIEVGKILKFCSWLEHHHEVSLQLLSWIRDQEDVELFSSSTFFQKAAHFGIFQGEGQALLQTLSMEDAKLSESETPRVPNLRDELLGSREVVVFGERSSGKTCEVLNCLPQGKYLLINACHYPTNQHLFEVMRAIKSLQGYSHLVFKHGLQFYPLMRDSLSGFRVIFVEESLAELQFGVVWDLRMVGYYGEGGAAERIAKKVLGNDEGRLFGRGTVFGRCLERLSEAAGERTCINQLYVNFARILQVMLKEEYEFNTSFLFSVFWSFGFSIQEKRLEEIIKQVFAGQEQQRSKFQKINQLDMSAQLSKSLSSKVRILEEGMGLLVRETFNNRLLALTDLIPIKKGKFANTFDQAGISNSFQEVRLASSQVVSMRSNFILNFSLLRSHLQAPLTLQGRDWLTTVLTASTPSTSRTFNFGPCSPSQAFFELFRGSRCISNFYSFPGEVKVAIDDVHMASLQTANCLTDLSEYGLAMFLDGGVLRIYQTSGWQFTFAGKSSYPNFDKAVRVTIEEGTIGTIFAEYIQSYCQKYLKVDRSIFSLLNLTTTLNRNYKQKQNIYYWYKNPILLLQWSGASTLTQYITLYLDYLIEIIPQQKSLLKVQRTLLEIPREEEDEDSPVINTTRKFIKFCNESELIDKLVADHEVLEEIQANQVQSIFFDRFIKSYFTKDILNYVLKVAKHIAAHHLILLADNYPHVEKILRYACKVASKSIMPLRSAITPNDLVFKLSPHASSKAVLVFNLEHCKDRQLEHLQKIVKLESNIQQEGKARIVALGNLASPKVKTAFEKFPFLKSHFLNIVMRPSQRESLKEIQAGSSNLLGENSPSDYLLKLQAIAKTNHFQDELKQEFVRVLQKLRRQELLNLQFYRKISSEMMINIDSINKRLEDIPAALAALAEREAELGITKSNNLQLAMELKVKLQKWQDKRNVFSDLFHFKHQKELQNLGRLNQVTTPLFNKMERIERRIEAIEALEFARLKNNLKNNENTALVQSLHVLLAYLNERGEALPKEKTHQFVASAFASPSVLASLLRAIRQRETYQLEAGEEGSHTNRLIATAMSIGRLKYVVSRGEEVAENAKKYEKVSPIYKPLSSWLAHFHSICLALKEYLQQQDEVDAHLTSRLTALNQKYGDEADISSQKQNLPVFMTESQNSMQEITDTLESLAQQGREGEIEQRKLLRLKRFYKQREERLQKITRLFSDSEYMKKVSAAVSLYFKNLDQLAFRRALIATTLNQHIPHRTLDPDTLLGVFTARADLFKFRDKLQAQSTGMDQLEIIYNLVQRGQRRVRLVEDRDSLIKGKLVEAAEARGFTVQVFRHVTYQQLMRYLEGKLAQSSRILLLHDSVHYLEAARADTLPAFLEFTEDALSLAQEKQAEVIYLSNWLPGAGRQVAGQAQFGRVIVTNERFMADLSDIFNVALQKEFPSKGEPKKRRGDLETVVREKNSMMKELMSSIQSLAKVVDGERGLFEEQPNDQAQSQQVFSQNLENQLINLMGLQEEAEGLQRETTNYAYLPASVRDLIQEELRRYLFLYSLTDRTNNTTNNTFFSTRDFYREWLALLKDLREERIGWFTRMEYRTVINEIVLKAEGDEKKGEQRKEEGETLQQANQAINPIFHRHNQEVFVTLVDRILRTGTWIEKSFLFQYALGAAVILAFETHSHPEYVSTILQLTIQTKQQINEECLKVFKGFQQEFYRGYFIRFDKLTSEFMETVAGNMEMTPGSEVVVLVYYFLLSRVNQYDPRVQDFLMKFGQAAEGKKEGLALRYQFLRTLKSLRVASEMALRLTPPLSLSINLQGKGQREKLITIIEEEKYLLSDLVEVLKLKSLGKKRQLESVLVDMRRKGQLVETLKQHYRASKQWLLLANFSVKERTGVRELLEEVVSELGRLPPNLTFRIFIILNREQEGPHSLFYNKYEVARLKGSHALTDADFCLAVNTLTLQVLFQGSRSRQLVEQLTVSITHDHQDFSIAETRLKDLTAIFGKVVRRYGLLREEDVKLFYRNLVDDLVRVGYLKKEHNQINFYQYLASYFAWTGATTASVRQLIEDERELAKEGLSRTELFQNNHIIPSVSRLPPIQRINTSKIQEYFKNINSEFAQALRKEIIINNLIEADQQFLSALQRTQPLSPQALQQAKRLCQIRWGLAGSEDWAQEAARRRLPLLRLLNNLKLREICLSKKVDIQSPSEFWIFLTAFQQHQIRQFTRQLQLDRSQLQSRYSNGIGLFGNFMNTRDYATRMRIVLVEEQSYHEMAISEQEMVRVLNEHGRVEGKFVLAIRKAGPQKIVELNVEYEEVEKILRRFNVVLQVGGELILEVIFK